MRLLFERVALVGLCVMIFCLPAAKAMVESFFGLAVFFWLLYQGRHPGRIGAELADLRLPLSIFVCINLLSALASTDIKVSLVAFVAKLLEQVAVCVMAAQVFNSRRRFTLLGVVVFVSFVVMLADGLWQYGFGSDFLRGFTLLDRRLRATFATGNDFGIWLATMIVFFTSLAMNGLRRPVRVVLLISAVWALALCLLTSSRGAWLSLGAGCVFLGIMARGRQRIWVFLVSAILAATALWRLHLNPDSTLQRLNLWREALLIIKDFPVVGTGLNTYTPVAVKYALSAQTGIYAHNSFLQMAAETGIAGLGAFFWFLTAFFRRGLRLLRQKPEPVLRGILAAIVVLLVHSLIDVNLYALQFVILFWFLIGVGVGYMRFLETSAV